MAWPLVGTLLRATGPATCPHSWACRPARADSGRPQSVERHRGGDGALVLGQGQGLEGRLGLQSHALPGQGRLQHLDPPAVRGLLQKALEEPQRQVGDGRGLLVELGHQVLVPGLQLTPCPPLHLPQRQSARVVGREVVERGARGRPVNWKLKNCGKIGGKSAKKREIAAPKERSPDTSGCCIVLQDGGFPCLFRRSPKAKRPHLRQWHALAAPEKDVNVPQSHVSGPVGVEMFPCAVAIQQLHAPSGGYGTQTILNITIELSHRPHAPFLVHKLLGPTVCVPKVARPDFPDCKFRSFPRWPLWSGEGGEVPPPPSRTVYGPSNTSPGAGPQKWPHARPRGCVPSRLVEYAGWYVRAFVRVRLCRGGGGGAHGRCHAVARRRATDAHQTTCCLAF